MRLVFSMVAVALPMLLFVVVIVLPWTAAQPVPPAVWALLALGVASLGGSAAAGRRPLPCGGPKGLVRAYQQRLFLGIAFAEAPAMLAFVAAFVAGAAWPYLVGVGTAAPGLARIAPTDGDVARKDAQLSAGGCATSLREALLAPKT